MSISIHGHHQVDPNEFSFGNEIQASQKAGANANLFAEDTVGITLPELTFTVTTPTGVISIPAGRITIGQFASALGNSLINSNDATRRGDFGDLLANAKLAQNGITDAFAAILARYQLISDLAGQVDQQITKDNTDIQTMNDAVTTYNASAGANPSDTDAVNTLNQAISDYNAGNIDQATYNAAVNTYNNYANGRNATIDAYNNALATYQAAAAANAANTATINANIVAFNATLPDGATPLPTLPTVPTSGPASGAVPFQIASSSPPATVPISLVGTPSFPPIGTSLTPVVSPSGEFASVKAAAQKTLDSITAEFNTKVALINLIHDIQERGSDYYHFTLKGKNPFVAPAYFDSKTPINFTAGGSSGGVIGATLTATSGDPALAGQASLATNLASQRFYQYKSTLPNLYLVDGYTSFLSHDVSVLTGVTVVSALGGKAITNPYAERAYGTVFGQTYAQTLAGITEGNQVDDFVAQFIKNQGISDQDGKIAANLTAQVKASLLQTGLLATETSANLPGLSQQINGNVLPPTTEPRSVSQVLNDNSALLFAQNQLGNVPLESISKLPIATTQDYRTAVEQSLLQQGSSPAEASRIADTALTLLQGEQTATPIQNSAVFDQTQVAAFLTQNNVDASVAAQVATELPTHYATNDFEYVTSVQTLLTQNNVNQPNLAQSLYNTLNIPPPQLTPDQIAQNLYSHTYNATVNAVGPDQATLFANQSAQTFVTGPNSVLSQLQAIKASQSVDDTQLQAIFRDFQSPSLDLFAFIDQLRDPGRTMLHTAATGLMYNGMPEPSNFKKSVDILV